MNTRALYWGTLAVAILASGPVWAGDPCPIRFEIADLGLAPWIPRPASVQQPPDPLATALHKYAKAQNCTKIGRLKIKNNALQVSSRSAGIKLDLIYRAVFTKSRRFRCRKAARKLARHLKDSADADGVVVVVRGTKRALLAVPGWKSFCVTNKSVEGNKLNDKTVARLWKRLTGALVKDRHDNP